MKTHSLLTKLVIVLGIIGGSTLGGAGCAVELGEVDGADDGDEVSFDGDDDGEDEDVASTSSELGGCNQCTNCVLYARCRQPRLPFGLTSWSDKVRAINSKKPRAGCVAMIQTGSQYGHVAYVRRVSGSKIYIDEGNWGGCNSRSGTASKLNIRGYWCR